MPRTMLLALSVVGREKGVPKGRVTSGASAPRKSPELSPLAIAGAEMTILDQIHTFQIAN